MRLFSALALLLSLLLLPSPVSAESRQLKVTMHTTPQEDYCPVCVATEALLRSGGVKFRKIREQHGPWPWFELTNSSGETRRIRGGLNELDIVKIKRGEFPRE